MVLAVSPRLAGMAKDKSLVHLLMEPEFIERIDDFRFANRFPSRNDAIRFLIEQGLKIAAAKPPPPQPRRVKKTSSQPD